MPSPDSEWTLGTIRTGSGGGGGLSGTKGGRTNVKYFTEEGVFFKNSACPRFVKEGYSF